MYVRISTLPVSPSLSFFPVWCPPGLTLFGYPTYEVSASYIKQQSAALNMLCQPGGGNVEFRQGNLSGITSFRVESGLHGNIRLLPPGVGPCMYTITVSQLLSVHSTSPWSNHLRCYLRRLMHMGRDMENLTVSEEFCGCFMWEFADTYVHRCSSDADLFNDGLNNLCGWTREEFRFLSMPCIPSVLPSVWEAGVLDIVLL